MGIRDRFNRVIKAEQNYQSSSNPSFESGESGVNQSATDLEKSILNLQNSIASAEANQARLTVQYDKARSEIVAWHQKAELAQKQGNKPAIQDALNRKQEQVRTASNAKLQLDQQTATLSALKRALEELEDKLTEIKPKIEPNLSAIAPETTPVLTSLESYSAKNAVMALEQLEEKILQMETRSQEAAKLAEAALENLAAVLKLSSSIDADLGALKKQLLQKPLTQQPSQLALPANPAIQSKIDPRSPQALVDADLEGSGSLDRLDPF